MSKLVDKEESYFSDICMEKCGGKCCAPWWGIVSYPMRIEGPFAEGKEALLQELIDAIEAREERIRANYITNETPPRSLFDTPEIYNVALESRKTSGQMMEITIRAMYAFRCLFLSTDNSCEIHPEVIGGEDIRPSHCGYMGSLEARYGEKGFCRIIHSAMLVDTDSSEVEKAIELEAR